MYVHASCKKEKNYRFNLSGNSFNSPQILRKTVYYIITKLQLSDLKKKNKILKYEIEKSITFNK